MGITDKMVYNSIIMMNDSNITAKQHIRQIEENAVTIGARVLPVSKSYRESFYTSINPI